MMLFVVALVLLVVGIITVFINVRHDYGAYMGAYMMLLVSLLFFLFGYQELQRHPRPPTGGQSVQTDETHR